MKRNPKLEERRKQIPEHIRDAVDKAFTMEHPYYWQVCPVCEGKGINLPLDNWQIIDQTKEGVDFTCPTCKGERIISTVTGKPPVKETEA